MTKYYWVGHGSVGDPTDGLNWSTTPTGTGAAGAYPGSGGSTTDIADFQTLAAGYTISFSNTDAFNPAFVYVNGSIADPITFQFGALATDTTNLQGVTLSFGNDGAGANAIIDTAGTVNNFLAFGVAGANTDLAIDVGQNGGSAIASTFNNESFITASGSAVMFLNASALGTYGDVSGGYTIGPGGRVKLSAALPQSQAIVFVDTATASNAILEIDSGGSASGAIAGFRTGDEIYLPGLTYAPTDTYEYNASNPAYGYTPTITISDGTNSVVLPLVFGAYGITEGGPFAFTDTADTNLRFSAGGGGTGVDVFTVVAQPIWNSGGIANTEWNDAGNWTTVLVPNATQTAMITGNGGSGAYTVTIGATDTGGSAVTAGLILLDDANATLNVLGRLEPNGNNGGVLALLAGTLNLEKSGSGSSTVFGRISASYVDSNSSPVQILAQGATVNFEGGDLQFVQWIGTLDLTNASGSVHILEPGGANTGNATLQGLQVQAADGTTGTVMLTGQSFGLNFNDDQTFDNATIEIGNALGSPGVIVGESSQGSNGLGGSLLTLGPNVTIESADPTQTLLAGINYSVPTNTSDLLEIDSQGQIIVDAATGSSFAIFANWTGANGTAPIFFNAGSFTVGGGETVNQHAKFVNTGTVTIGSTSGTATFAVTSLGNNFGNGTFYNQGGVINVNGGGAFGINAGTSTTGAFIGFGTISGSVTDGGRIEASPTAFNGTNSSGTLTITGTVGGSGTAQIDSFMTLAVDGSLNQGGGTIFQDHATLVMGSPGPGHGAAMSGFDFHDTLVLKNLGASYASISFTYNSGNSGPGTLTLFNGGAAPNYVFNNFSLAADVTTPASRFQITQDVGGDNIITIACFAAGTRIATPSGEIPVEDLRVGDAVITRDGTQPITWIGQRHIDLARHPRPELARPIRVSRDAFAPGIPARDLLLSPDHAVFWNGRLAEAKRLVNGTSVVQEAPASITYFHIELAAHDIVFAEGLTSESYLDTGNRCMFENAPGALMLHPDFAATPAHRRRDACAPMVFHGPALAAIRQHLLDRAGRLGFATTDDPGLYLLADGKRIDAATLPDGRRRFSVPKGIAELRLRSRTGIPALLLADCVDERTLGAFIGAITVNDPNGRRALAPDNAPGWYPPEPEGSWTNGDARLDLSGPCTLEITLAGTLPYPNLRRRAA